VVSGSACAASRRIAAGFAQDLALGFAQASALDQTVPHDQVGQVSLRREQIGDVTRSVTSQR
jgi:hypothetical protein